ARDEDGVAAERRREPRDAGADDAVAAHVEAQPVEVGQRARQQRLEAVVVAADARGAVEEGAVARGQVVEAEVEGAPAALGVGRAGAGAAGGGRGARAG